METRHARHDLGSKLCMGNEQVDMTVHLSPVEGDQKTCIAKISQAELCQALGVNAAIPECTGITQINLVASETPAGGTTAYSLYHGNGDQLQTAQRASVFTDQHAMSHHFVHQGKALSHSQVPLEIAQSVTTGDIASGLKRVARWDNHASQDQATMKDVMRGITSLKVTSGPDANTVVHAVPVIEQGATTEEMGAMTTLFARNRDNAEFNQQVFNSKTSPETVQINGQPHFKVADTAMQQLQANMKENLTKKQQVTNGLVIKSTRYGGDDAVAEGPAVTFRIKRTPLSSQIGMSQSDTEANQNQVVDLHSAMRQVEGPETVVLSAPKSDAISTQETTAQIAGSALFGQTAHTVEPVTYDD